MKFLDFLDSDEPALICDGVTWARRDLLRLAYGAAEAVQNRGPRVALYSSGNAAVIPFVLGCYLAGKSVIVLPHFLDGRINDYLMSAHKPDLIMGCGFYDGQPFSPQHGEIGLLSSGSSGNPRLNYTQPFFFNDEMYEATREWYLAKTGHSGSRIYMTAPVGTAAVVYLSLISLGYIVEFSQSPPSTDTILSAASRCDGLGLRPSLIERLERENARAAVDYVLSSTGDLRDWHVQYCRKSLGALEVWDAYACTELGTVGLRNAVDELGFELLPMVNLTVAGDGEALLSSPVGSASTGDIVTYDDHGLRLVSKAKLKVSGYTIYPPVIAKTLVDVSGSEAAEVFLDDGVLAARYVGPCYNEDELRSLMLEQLPFYSVPKRFFRVKSLNGGVASNEQYHV